MSFLGFERRFGQFFGIASKNGKSIEEVDAQRKWDSQSESLAPIGESRSLGLLGWPTTEAELPNESRKIQEERLFMIKYTMRSPFPSYSLKPRHSRVSAPGGKSWESESVKTPLGLLQLNPKLLGDFAKGKFRLYHWKWLWAAESIEEKNPLYFTYSAKVYEGCAAIGPCILIQDEITRKHQNKISKFISWRKVAQAVRPIWDSNSSPQVPISNWTDMAFTDKYIFHRYCLMMTGTGNRTGWNFTLAEGDQDKR